ncbi:MAG TPA: carotenoid biosynthesis protein [Mycobacteriales bacterium]|nr:carotenoid biosynthesis protein [Mycobacteriales bacterium]
MGSRGPAVLGGLVVLAQVAYPLTPRGGPRDGLTVATVLLFALASLVHAYATRGPRAGLALLVVAGGGGLLAESVGVSTGLPFGTYSYAGSLGPRLAGVPLVIPLAWVMMAWPALLVAARLTASRPARVAVGAVALASWDLFLDPQMVDAGHWRWADPSPGLPGVDTVPLTNYAGWLLVALLLMLVLDRAVPVRPSTSDTVPYALYLWTYFSSILALAAFFGLPAAALWGALGMGTVALPLLRSLRGRVRVG